MLMTFANTIVRLPMGKFAFFFSLGGSPTGFILASSTENTTSVEQVRALSCNSGNTCFTRNSAYFPAVKCDLRVRDDSWEIDLIRGVVVNFKNYTKYSEWTVTNLSALFTLQQWAMGNILFFNLRKPRTDQMHDSIQQFWIDFAIGTIKDWVHIQNRRKQ